MLPPVRIVAAIALSGSCACTDLYSLAVHGFTTPAVEATGTRATPSGGSVLVSVDFAARNPNPYPLDFDGVDYTGASQGVTVFAGSHGAFSVPEQGMQTVALDGAVPSSTLTQLHLLPGQAVGYVLSGTLHVKTPAGVRVDVDFSTNGTLVVPAAAR